jgi:hypothetical protein
LPKDMAFAAAGLHWQLKKSDADQQQHGEP